MKLPFSDTGTFLGEDPDYAALYAATSNRSLVLSGVTEGEGRTAALYELSFDVAAGQYRETGVLVLHHEPLRLDHMRLDLEDARSGLDVSIAGQAADIGSTALALSAGLTEGNPLVSEMISSPAGWAAIVALKLIVPSLAGGLPLSECVAVRTALASTGWAAAAWNLSAMAGAASGVGAAVALVSGLLAAAEAANDAPVRCAGLTVERVQG